MSANCATWTSERIELLKRCLYAGLSCGQTARQIGVTRNAVIGKMNRLGLSRPKDVIGRQLEQRRAARLARPKTPRTWRSKRPRLNIFAQQEMLMVTFRRPQPPAEDIPYLQRTWMHAARAQPGEMPLADQQPGRPGLLLLRERTSQRIALLPGARAHCISVGRSAAQQRGCVSIPPQPSRRETRCSRGFINHFVRGTTMFAVLRGRALSRLEVDDQLEISRSRPRSARSRAVAGLPFGRHVAVPILPQHQVACHEDARPSLPGAAEVRSAPHHGGRCARPFADPSGRAAACRIYHVV